MEAKIRLAPGVVFPEELLRAILIDQSISVGIQEGGILQAATARPMIRKVVLAVPARRLVPADGGHRV